MRKSSHVLDESKAATSEEREGLNRPRLSRRACALLSWAAVAIMLAFIFCMSAKTGNDLDNHSGIVSIVKNLLVAGAQRSSATRSMYRPMGLSRNTCCLAPRSQTRCASRRGPHSKTTRPRVPAGMLGDFPAPLIALIFSSLYGVSDEFHQIFTPSRSCDPMDWLVDTCAAAIGAAIVWTAFEES